MAKIQERINNISDYFRGMEIQNGFYIVRVQYGHRWGAYSRQDEKIKATRSEEIADEWFYYAETENVEFDEIFDLIDETIKMNLSALAKVELLKTKIEELKVLFEDTPLEVLETLEFVFTAHKQSKRRKYTKKTKEEHTEPLESEITPTNEEVKEKEVTV